MKSVDLMLTKKETSISYKSLFQVPIHHRLFDPGLKIDPSIAQRIFPLVAQEWYEDLKQNVDDVKLDSKEKKWIEEVYLEETPVIKERYGTQYLNRIGWEDNVNISDNGLVTSFSINRNAGGSLYFLKGDGCEITIPLEKDSRHYHVKISPEKAREFGYGTHNLGKIGEVALIHVYAQHNVDHYPGALFLRNWAITYMNEALKFIKSL